MASSCVVNSSSRIKHSRSRSACSASERMPAMNNRGFRGETEMVIQLPENVIFFWENWDFTRDNGDFTQGNVDLI